MRFHKPLSLLLSVSLSTFLLPVQAADSVAAGHEQKLTLDNPLRSAENMKRDHYRHPLETLRFFGIRENMTVVEVWPGVGWYSEILAPYLHDKGQYYAAHFDPAQGNYFRNGLDQFKAKLAGAPQAYDKVHLTEFAPPAKLDLAPAGSADMVLTFRNVHNWYMDGGGDANVQAAFQAFYTVLKPGGVLGVVDHRLPADRPASDMEESGYLHQAYVIRMAQAAGFRLLASSEINANPKDKADHIVWALPPTFAYKEKDQDKYAAIGESDRMTLKFVK